MALPAFVPITDNRSFVRHTSSMAVVNVNTTELERYRKNRDRILADRKMLESTNEEVVRLRQELNEFRAFVQSCLARDK